MTGRKERGEGRGRGKERKRLQCWMNRKCAESEGRLGRGSATVAHLLNGLIWHFDLDPDFTSFVAKKERCLWWIERNMDFPTYWPTGSKDLTSINGSSARKTSKFRCTKRGSNTGIKLCPSGTTLTQEINNAPPYSQFNTVGLWRKGRCERRIGKIYAGWNCHHKCY